MATGKVDQTELLGNLRAFLNAMYLDGKAIEGADLPELIDEAWADEHLVARIQTSTMFAEEEAAYLSAAFNARSKGRDDLERFLRRGGQDGSDNKPQGSG